MTKRATSASSSLSSNALTATSTRRSNNDIYILMKLLLFICITALTLTSSSHYKDGGYLFTETLQSTCDYQDSNSYVYDYETLGGASLDTVTTISFAFWMQYRTSHPDIPQWVSMAAEYSQVFYLSDQENSLTYRMLSFGVKQEGTETVVQIYQQHGDFQGPTLTYFLQPHQKTLFNDNWSFVWISYNYQLLKFVLQVYDHTSTPYIDLIEQCPAVLNVDFCDETAIERPYLRRPNMKLYVGLHGPYLDDNFRQTTFCGDIGGFQFYKDIEEVHAWNLDSIKYGFNRHGIYSLYRMDSYGTTDVVHDYSSQRKHGKVASIGFGWEQFGFAVTDQTKIVLPDVEFNEFGGRFCVGFYFKADAGLTSFVVLKRMYSAVGVFELILEWQVQQLKHFIKYRNEVTFFNFLFLMDPDQWHHLLFVFQEKNFENLGDQVITVYWNDNDPITVVATGIEVFDYDRDDDIVTIGNQEVIPAGKKLVLHRVEVHQGARVIRHNDLDDYEPACQVSILKENGKSLCWQCHKGFYWHDDLMQCVPEDECNQIRQQQANLDLRQCVHECAPQCKSCNIGTPTVCIECMGSMVVDAMGQCTCPTGFSKDNELDCYNQQNIAETVIGEFYDDDLQVVSIGSGLRQESKSIGFPYFFSTVPSVLIGITSIEVLDDYKFQVFVTGTTSQSFVLQIIVRDNTRITKLGLKYLATLDYQHYQINAISLETPPLKTGVGERKFKTPLAYAPWDQRFDDPIFIPYLIGMERSFGTENVTLYYEIKYYQNSLELYTITNGDNCYDYVHWNYIMVPKYLEKHVIFHSALSEHLHVSQLPVPLSGQHRFNVTAFTYQNPQEYNNDHFFGLSRLTLYAGSIINYDLEERRLSEHNFELRFSAFSTSVFEDYEVNIFTLAGKCDVMSCTACEDSPMKCLACKDVSRDPAQSCLDCLSSQYIEFVEFTCQPCSPFCVGCTKQPDNCLDCPDYTLHQRTNNIVLKCPCNIHYYDDGTMTCKECDYKCGTCIDEPTNCEICAGTNRDLDNFCICKDQFYDFNEEFDCRRCSEPCDLCDQDGCLTCLGNRVIDANKDCVCGNGVALQDSWFCDTCSDAPLDVLLLDTLDILQIKFPEPVEFTSIKYLNLNNSALCPIMIQEDTLDQYGQGAECFLEGDKVQVRLGKDPTLIEKDVVVLNPSIFKRLSCITPLNNFFFTEVKYVEEFRNPEFDVDRPEAAISICNEIEVKVANLTQHGNRAVQMAEWRLLNDVGSKALEENINIVLEQANQQNSLAVKFPKEMLDGYKVYRFAVLVQSYMLKNTTREFEFETLGRTQPYLDLETPNWLQHNFKQELVIPVDVYFIRCESGRMVEYTENLTLTWAEKSRDPPANKALIETEIVQQVPPRKLYLSLPSQSGQVQTTYKVSGLVRYQEEDLLIEVEELIDIEMIYLGIGITILGGDRIVGASDTLVLNAITWDPNDEGTPYNADKSIDLQWTCTQTSNSKPCAIDTTSWTRDVTIPPGTFEKGYSYQIAVRATKAERTSQFHIHVNVLHYSIPPFNPHYPIGIHMRKLDIKQLITLRIDHHPHFTYSYTIVYINSPYATIQLKYPLATFRLIDYLPSLLTEQRVSIQVVAKNNSEPLPQVALIPVTINLPPQGGELLVDPEAGEALETIFNIEVVDIIDSDIPLQYRLSLYPSESHYMEDVINAQELYEIPITEYQLSPLFSTVLPSNYQTDGLTTSKAFIMVTIMDSKGVTRNITSQLTVTRNHKLYMDYVITIESLQLKIENLCQYNQALQVFKNPSDVIIASLESILQPILFLL